MTTSTLKTLAQIVAINQLSPGDRVLVNWGKRGWLPGTFQDYSTPEPRENFSRCVVRMDNGFTCDGAGYHPNCVKKA